MGIPPEGPGHRERLETRLRGLSKYYHSHHPYQVMMNRGELSPRQLQGWIANRYYYQISVPLKDAALISQCPDRAVRRRWARRLHEHDGCTGEEGGIEAWINLGEAVGLSREEMTSERQVLPGVRFAVDAYVNFVRRRSWVDGVCASLTELFAPAIHRERLANWPRHYPWIDPAGLTYFRSRIDTAEQDVQYGLALVLEHFNTPEGENRAVRILKFKLEVLWSMLDAMYLAYVMNMPPFFNAPENR